MKSSLHFTQMLSRIRSQNRISLLFDQCCNINHVYQIHGFMFTRGLDYDSFFLSRLIEVCSNTNLLNHAISLFSHIAFKKNMYIYNTMINAFSSSFRVKDVFLLYNEARVIGLRPDSYTIPFLLKGVMSYSLGKSVHCNAISVGLDSEGYVGLGLVKMYLVCGYVSDARKVFDGMLVRDLAVWNTMVSGYCKVGEVEKAWELFELMPEKNVISWTTLIMGFSNAKMACEAVNVFRKMQVNGVRPDEVAMLAVLLACAQLGALELGEWIHCYINEHKLHKSISLNNVLIDMYAKSGNITKAIEVFENMKDKCVITWTTAISGLALHGFGKEAIQLFSRMEKASVKPNGVTLIAVLSACSHSGLVESGRFYFNNMIPKYAIEPRIEHYGCMIDLLGRSGCLLEAQEVLKSMPFEPNAAIWGSILAASRIYGNVELGERALRHLVNLEPNNSGNFSLLSNIYASVGYWNESGLMRKVMRDSGVKKMLGSSWIELDSRVHEFISGNSSHARFERIFEVLSELNQQMEVTDIFNLKNNDI